jgi:rhodanese-related sulfurtransferase
MRKTVKSMVDDAMSVITTYSVEEAQELHGRDDVQFVDIRDVRELEREGIVPGAFHAPRGMLEFWVDPESPYHKPLFGENKQFVLFCAAGWRSALATKTLQGVEGQGRAGGREGEERLNAWLPAASRCCKRCRSSVRCATMRSKCCSKMRRR